MAVQYSFGKIVTDGLVLALDAADRNSYVSGSTTWFDVSGNNNSGSLVNGPTFNSGNGGSIVFDGVDDYVSLGNNSNLQTNQGTVSTWIKTTQPGSNFRGIVTKQNNYGLFTNNGVLVTYDWGNVQTRTTGINIADGTWKNIVMSFTTNTGTPLNNAVIYLNGVEVLLTTIKFLNNNVEVQVANGGAFSSVQFTQVLNGNIPSVQIYNRALSASEVLQNYNAQKSRFGLT